MTALPLVTVSSCEGCGACCAYVGVPPGYGQFYFSDREEPSASAWSTDDGIAWLAMPEELRAELFAYDAALQAGTSLDRTLEVMPCLWLDPVTRQCRHYEWRPKICRDFPMGGPACVAMRKGEGIDGPGYLD